MLAQPAVNRDAFAEARESFGAIETFLGSKEACSLRESDLERELEKRGRELMRQLLEAHIEVRGPGEAAAPVKGTDGEERVQQRRHDRGLETVFGEVRIERAGYVAKGMDSLHPMDADLNLPQELYSHEVRRRVGWAAAGSSFLHISTPLRARGISGSPWALQWRLRKKTNSLQVNDLHGEKQSRGATLWSDTDGD